VIERQTEEAVASDKFVTVELSVSRDSCEEGRIKREGSRSV